jgi:hypothetical protein
MKLLLIVLACGFVSLSVSAQTITAMGSSGSGTITPVNSGGSSGSITPMNPTITPIKQPGVKTKPTVKTLLPAVQECKTLDVKNGDVRFERPIGQSPYTQIVSTQSVFKGIANNDTNDGAKRYFDIELNRDFGITGKTSPNGTEGKFRNLVTHGLGALIGDTSYQHFFQVQSGMTLQPTQRILVKYNINTKWAKFYSGIATICVL